MEQAKSAILASVLAKYPLRKAIRIGTWIKRFIDNSRRRKDERKHDPLTTEEEEGERLWWIKEVQKEATSENCQLHLLDYINHIIDISQQSYEASTTHCLCTTICVGT